MIYIRLFFSVVWLLMILVYFAYIWYLKSKNTTIYQILNNKRLGMNCYSCNQPIHMDGDDLELHKRIKRIMFGEESLCLCQSCQRDVKLSNLLHTSNFILKFNKWILTRNSEKIMVAFLFIPIIPMILSFLFLPGIMNIASLCNNMFLTFYWFIMIYRVYLNRK